ncbi:MAG: hypothetical protein WA990_10855 [Rubrobacteraceae bacterium]
MNASEERNGREAVKDYADITRESYRIVVDRAFVARESNPHLSRDFFEKTMVEIQEQTTLSRGAARKPWDHARQWNGAPGLIGEAAGLYEEFLGPLQKDTRR